MSTCKRDRPRSTMLAGVCMAVATQTAAAAPEPFFAIAGGDTYYDAFHGLGPGGSNGMPVVYFRIGSIEPAGSTLWRSDGSADGTHPAVPESHAGRVGHMLVPQGGGAYFLAADDGGTAQIHWTDGSASATSTRQLTDEPAGVAALAGLISDRPAFVRRTPDGESLMRLVDMQGTLSTVLEVDAPANHWAEWVLGPAGGLVMWQTRTSPGGYRVTRFGWHGELPTLLPPPAPATSWVYPHAAGAGAGIFCLKAYTADGARLHCTDGTAAGTIRPVPPTLGSDVWIPDFVTFRAVGERLIFITHALSGPYRPWTTDGTHAGTQALLDFGPSPVDVCTDDDDGTIYFTGDDSDGATALWRTDGTREGTQRIASAPGRCGHRGVSRALDGRAYIAAGTTLLVTDGTESGTHPVVGAPPLQTSSQETGYRGIAAAGRWILFAAADGAGTMLWRIDLDPVFAGGFD